MEEIPALASAYPPALPRHTFCPAPLLQTPIQAPPPTPLLPSSPISARCNVSPLPLLTRWSSLIFSTCGLALLRTSNILHQPSCLYIKTPRGKNSHITRLWSWGSYVVFSKPCFPITLLLFPFAAAVTVCCPPNYPWLLVSSVPYILTYFSSLRVRSIGPRCSSLHLFGIILFPPFVDLST